jgi:hypothetical protein
VSCSTNQKELKHYIMSSITLTYWPIKARSYAIMAVAKVGGVNVTPVTEFDLAALKPSLPFGQLPLLGMHVIFKPLAK